MHIGPSWPFSLVLFLVHRVDTIVPLFGEEVYTPVLPYSVSEAGAQSPWQELQLFMYRRRILRTFHIAVDFQIVLKRGLYGRGKGGGEAST